MAGTLRPPAVAAAVIAGGLTVAYVAAWAWAEPAGRWFLAGAGGVAAVAAVVGVVVDRLRTRRLRDLIDYLGEDVDARKLASLPDEHRVRIEGRARDLGDGHRRAVQTGRLP